MRRIYFLSFLTCWFFAAGSGASAQKLTMDGITTIRISYDGASPILAATAYIVHSFPAYADSQVSDTLSVTKSKLWLSCPVHVAQEGSVDIGDTKIHLFMIPADTIYIEVRGVGDKLTYEIQGKSKHIQNYYRAKSATFPVAIGQRIINNWDDAANLTDFKTRADSLNALEQAFLDGYKDKKLLPPRFVRYESDAIRYQSAWLRLRALSYRNQVRRVVEKVPLDYFKFLETVPVRNVAAIYDYEYLNFLREYVSYKSVPLAAPGKPNPDRFASHDKVIDLLGKRIGEFYIIFSISEALTDNPKIVETALAKHAFSESDNYLVTYVKQEASKRIGILSAGNGSPNFYLADRLDSLVSLSQFRGQVVYLSFWFAGCKGCIEEFPHENEMVAKFSKEPVKIMSICTRTTREKWLKMIDNYGLKTLNLYANSAWGNKLEEKFGISVYPHYVLIGPDGTVIENFASRPSRGASEKISQALAAVKSGSK